MFEKQKMVNRVTVASSPCCRTQDKACWPINFRSSIQSTSVDDFDDSQIILHKEKENKKENVFMNMYIIMVHVSSYIEIERKKWGEKKRF